ncbi:hypothetical protein RclHR1_03890020 [Rhizophagus clarus]|uniref:Uncharacterized protein n=1 Tax=Rhizophagus clarus TaxID=94130 RepID=A0A2Z6RQP7_9GLOM|nr:hypothetical protein RclHR1_03890020 [Rhizophagus clarus]GES83451.1 hypothetical protein GLOIN_2v1778400 [Rhizophagus clarus]
METSDLTNDPELFKYFFAVWALKEHQKSIQKQDIKPISEQIKALLTTMFLNSNVDKRKKMNAQEMYNELMCQANQGEISKEDISKTSTIHNWIARTAASFKIHMSEHVLEEAEASNII